VLVSDVCVCVCVCVWRALHNIIDMAQHTTTTRHHRRYTTLVSTAGRYMWINDPGQPWYKPTVLRYGFSRTRFCYAARWDDKSYIIVFGSHYALSSTCRRRLIAFRIILLFSLCGYTLWDIAPYVIIVPCTLLWLNY